MSELFEAFLPLLVPLAIILMLVLARVAIRMIRNPVAWADGDLAEQEVIAEEQRQRSLVEGLARRLQPIATSLAGERMVTNYRRQLDAAGNPDGITVESFLGRKAAYSLLFGVVGVLLIFNGSFFMGLAMPVTGFFLQDLWLRRTTRTRQAKLERDLPDFLDVLAVTVEAGLGFQAAMARVLPVMTGPLQEELTRTRRQIRLGMGRREAFEELRERNNSDILAQFVTALLQAWELGAPLAGSLRVMADDLRESWYQVARRQAAKAGPKVSMIVSFTLVPGSMLLILTAFVLSSDFSVGGG